MIHRTIPFAAAVSAFAAGMLAQPTPALAEECLLDTNGDGTATDGIDTADGADGSGAGSLACGTDATASGIG